MFSGILTPLAGGTPLQVNAQTGLAISGFDPVAYFTDARASLGRADLELSLGGAVWRFHNWANRAAFKAHPDVYTPRFGGFDPVAIARGASVPGHPEVWAVVSERLYLFYDEAARAAFLADPGRVVAAAERRWSEVARTAVP
jgi:hypothetical protein